MNLNTVDKNFLRENGLKPTAQRLAIYKILFSEGDKHFTAEEIKKIAKFDAKNKDNKIVDSNIRFWNSQGY